MESGREINLEITRQVYEASQTNRSSESQEMSALKNGRNLQKYYELSESQKGKCKVHRCTGTETLYRPYGP